MRQNGLGDLTAFLAVAEERSFTRAAARLGTSQSALSHTVRRLEERLGLRLLTRTTRSVAPTEAGDRLLETLRPALDEIDAKLTALGELREKPAGTVRITTSRHAAETILWPALARLLPDYPDIRVELSIDPALTDIVAERFDAGVRLGEQVAKDMIAVRIGPELRMALVGAPAYFTRRPAPETPHDLTRHACINLRMSTLGGLYAWEFEKDGRPLNVRVDGQLVLNDMSLILKAAVEGLGLAYTLEDQVLGLVEEGKLLRVLSDWCPPFPGYHLYYPSRRQQSPAFALLVEALRHRVSR
ncbi:LysR family transcriptional regulator [Labrys wisconsinensis]|uniref:DNA-binding transcriptional LysR family regulator n=1 Tax=Labrys wisconsinensis TaxID=425677 RepID=A0ABU0J4U4_9HYPH|nr:LysR family transcriptional regulator [Labrys wisconsinensis]MDQ0468571.1 DNA-binding transcriptional LysR family regulator [Labrys wisconsinensis]